MTVVHAEQPVHKHGSENHSAHDEHDSKPSKPLTEQDFTGPENFINRELSWMEFNQRVLDEALNKNAPLLERVKFLAISFSNLDEFIMIRVSGLQQKAQAGLTDLSPDGLTPVEQMDAVRKRYARMLQDSYALWSKDLVPALRAANVRIRDYASLSRTQKRDLRAMFEKDFFPVLTPLAIDPGHPFPHISNLSLNLAVQVRDPDRGERFARMKIPGVLPRLVPVPNGHAKHDAPQEFVWLEQVVAANLELLFPGLEVIDCHPFRVTRDADIEIQEDEASDLLQTVEQGLRQRQFGAVVRLELPPKMPAPLRALLTSNLLVDAQDVYDVPGPLGMSDLIQLGKLDRPDLKDAPYTPSVPAELANPVEQKQIAPMLETVAQHDVLLHHPYDSFQPVVFFIEGAAHEENVLAIKQTLYRVGSRSPIVKALAAARDDDTQVAVLVELKARFDEENNIEWARALEDAGVHVVYGLLGLKTHCKVALVVRREAGGIKRYLHLGTGNYNATTARLYTDFSFLTAREDLAADASELFNVLTGYSHQARYRKLLVAPVNMRERLTALIEREADHARRGRPARVLFKMNALEDPQMIRSLYAASCAGVRVDLLVRGTCCLRPGVPGVSENIRVVSVVGRFLEHSRAYYFHNGGRAASLYLGSADLMRRNLNQRVEVLFPIEDAKMRRRIRDQILEHSLRDTAQARELGGDGVWRRVAPPKGVKPFDSQAWFMAQASGNGDKAGIL